MIILVFISSGSRFMSLRSCQLYAAARLSDSVTGASALAQFRSLPSNFDWESGIDRQENDRGRRRDVTIFAGDEPSSKLWRSRVRGGRGDQSGQPWRVRWRGRDGYGREGVLSIATICGGDRGVGRRQAKFMSGGEPNWTERHRIDRNPRWGSDGNFRRDGRVSRSSTFVDEYRQWCFAENQLPPNHEKFVLVSYNILADKNAAEHYYELYQHIPWWLMQWDRRKNKLLQELHRLSPDIMCLQEVDKFEDLRSYFERRGYSGTYKGRTGGALDGCAIFWKNTRFRLLQEESIQFNELNLRDNVAQLCVFQSVDRMANESNFEAVQNSGSKSGPGRLLVVGNIHVLFNPKRGDVKLGQVRTLLESAHALSKKWGDAPVTIAGDFNSTPMSDLYKFLARSELDISGLNRATMSGQVEARPSARFQWTGQLEQRFFTDGSSTDSGSSQPEQWAGTGSPNDSVKRWHWTPEEILAATGTLDCTTLRHNLNLRSAYSQIKGEDGCRDPRGEPVVTTYHRKFMGTVDYIWHTEGIDTVKVLDTLPIKVLQRSQGLPSQKWGSDHLALVCELAFLLDSQAQDA